MISGLIKNIAWSEIKKLLLLLLVLFVLLTEIHSQQYSSLIKTGSDEIQFSHLTVEDGLSINAVTKIIQDSKGFLWFGTYNGLNRYDGYNFKIFLPESSNPQSISNHSIWSLYEDS